MTELWTRAPDSVERKQGPTAEPQNDQASERPSTEAAERRRDRKPERLSERRLPKWLSFGQAECEIGRNS